MIVVDISEITSVCNACLWPTEHEHKDGKAPLSNHSPQPAPPLINKVHERQKLSPFSVNYFHRLGGGPDTIVNRDDDDLPRFPAMPLHAS